MQAVEGRVSGRVQGVSYRASLQQEAEAAGLRGWVRNRDDGSVAFHLQGAPEAVERVLAWVRRGPPAARVDEVQVDEVAPDAGLERFEVRP